MLNIITDSSSISLKCTWDISSAVSPTTFVMSHFDLFDVRGNIHDSINELHLRRWHCLLYDLCWWTLLDRIIDFYFDMDNFQSTWINGPCIFFSLIVSIVLSTDSILQLLRLQALWSSSTSVVTQRTANQNHHLYLELFSDYYWLYSFNYSWLYSLFYYCLYS